MATCEHGMPLNLGCDDCTIARLNKQRKDDEALIRKLVEALEGYRRNHNDGQPCDAEKAGRARLEKAP